MKRFGRSIKKRFLLAGTSKTVTFLPTMYPSIISQKTLEKPVESPREIFIFLGTMKLTENDRWN